MCVQFDLPEHVRNTHTEFSGQKVTVEYDSNYNDRGETVTVSGVAEIDIARPPNRFRTLVVDGRHIRANGHVFADKGGRHLGTVVSVTVTLEEDVAVELVTQELNYDLDRGAESTIIQAWGDAVAGAEEYMANTLEVRLMHS